jgi:hypothetical protein
VSSSQSHLLIAAVALTLAPIAVAVGQSSVAVSPFASYVPSAAQNPLVGMALTFGGTTGLALRGSADISIKNPERTTATEGSTAATAGGMRPWGADADAMLFLGGLGGGATVFSRALSPYVFSGIGLTGGDSAGVNVVNNVWSYGAGATIPLGFDASLFGEDGEGRAILQERDALRPLLPRRRRRLASARARASAAASRALSFRQLRRLR